MNWQRLTDPGDLFMAMLVSRIDLIDRDRQLVLTHSHGRSKWAPKHHVLRYSDPDNPHRSKDYPKLLTIRAWTIDEALEILSDPKTDKRIEKALAKRYEAQS
jgi:hypothetical protein